MRLIHVSDIHVWRYAFNPLQLFSKRLLGMVALLVRRARKFRLERLGEVVERVASLNPDHILITGDLTTTALPVEFRAARHALEPLLADPARVTIIPGNHDRYTVGARSRPAFEEYFGDFAPSPAVSLAPTARRRDGDPRPRPDPGAPHGAGLLPRGQLERARELLSIERPRARGG